MIAEVLLALALSQTIPFEVVKNQVELPETSAVVKMRKSAGDQQKRAAALLLKWQTRLGLMHYHLSIQVDRLESFPPHEIGKLFLDQSTGMGYISILDAGDYLKTNVKEVPQRTLKAILLDQQDSVVHELVHIMMYNPYPENSENFGNYTEYKVIHLTKQILEKK